MTMDARWFMEWLGESALRTMLLAMVVAGVMAVVRARSVDANRMVWRWVLAAGLLMPALTLLVPTIGVPIWTAEEPPDTVVFPMLETIEVPIAATVGIPVEEGFIWESVVVALYGLVAIGLLLRLTLGYWRISRLRGQAGPVHVSIAGPAGVRIVASGHCRVPFTFGWLDPIVVLPSQWRGWSSSQLGIVLTHEFAHVANRDFLIQMLAAVHRCLFWFSPLSWWLERRLASLAEQAGDDAVLRSGHDAIEYADWLYRFLGQGGDGRLGAALISMAGSGPAIRRIDRILDPARQPTRPLGMRARIALTALFLPMLWLCAGSSAVARPALPAALQVQSPPEAVPLAPAATERVEVPVMPAVPVAPEPPQLPPVKRVPLVVDVAPPGAKVGVRTGVKAGVGAGVAAGVDAGVRVGVGPGPRPVVRPGPIDLEPVSLPSPMPVPVLSPAPLVEPVPQAMVAPRVALALPWPSPAPRPPAQAPQPIGEPDTWEPLDMARSWSHAVVTRDGPLLGVVRHNDPGWETLRSKIGSDFIWFREGDEASVIVDEAFVGQAVAIASQLESSGAEHRLELDRRQKELDERRTELMDRQVKMAVPNADVREELSDLIKRLRELRSQGVTDKGLLSVEADVRKLRSQVSYTEVQDARDVALLVIEQRKLEEERRQLATQRARIQVERRNLIRGIHGRIQQFIREAVEKGLAQPEP